MVRIVIAAVPGVRLLMAVSAFESDTFKLVPRVYRVMGKVMSLVPALRMMSQYQRYAF